MDPFSCSEAATVFGCDHKTVAKHARRLEAAGLVTLMRGLRVVMLDEAAMDQLAFVFDEPDWRREARRVRRARAVVPA
jgi:predicted transcriptional regulator